MLKDACGASDACRDPAAGKMKAGDTVHAWGSVPFQKGELGGHVVIARRPLLAGYAIWWAALIVAYYGLPGLRTETWGLLGLSGVAAIVAGVLIHRPARMVPWLLLAAANLSFVAGQVSFLVASLIQHQPLPFPSYADVLYLLTYPLIAAGLVAFIRARNPGAGPAQRDRRADADRGPGPGLVDVPGPALRPQSAAVLAAEERVHRLPAGRRAGPGPAGPVAGSGDRTQPVVPAAHPGHGRPAGVRHLVRRSAAVRLVSQRDRGRPGLGCDVRGVGCGRAAPDHGPADRAGLPAAAAGITQPAGRAHAGLADRPGRAVHPIAPAPQLRRRRHRGVLRGSVPAGHLQAVGHGGVPPAGAEPGAHGPGGRRVAGLGRHRGRGRGGDAMRLRRPDPIALTARCAAHGARRWPLPHGERGGGRRRRPG